MYSLKVQKHGGFMKKLLLAFAAIASFNGHMQGSWASAAKTGAATLAANMPLMYTVWSHKNESARIGQEVASSIQAATVAGNAVTQQIESATAELAKFSPIMKLSALQDASSMSWSQWVGNGSINFVSHVASTIFTTIAMQLLMHAAMNSMQNIASSIVEQEHVSQVKNAVPANSSAQAQQQALTPAEIARRKRVVTP